MAIRIWRRASFTGTKFGGGGKKWNRKARAGKNSFPPTPFLFARPSDWILKFEVRIFVKKSSNINQETPPVKLSGLIRVIKVLLKAGKDEPRKLLRNNGAGGTVLSARGSVPKADRDLSQHAPPKARLRRMAG